MRSVAQSLLTNREFDIEFHGYLSNHVKHAIIALERLDAPEERIQEYWDFYTNLTPYKISLHRVDVDWDVVKPCTLQQWKDWRGKKVHWQEQVAFMHQELTTRFQNDTNQLVQHYAPDLLSGVAGALTHGIIHLGWAIDAQSPWMIVEGLAYLNFCHVGLDVDSLSFHQLYDNESGPMDSFVRVAQEYQSQNLKSTWIDRVKASRDETFHPELVPAGFQWELAKVLEEPHPVATNLPLWLEGNDGDDEHLWKEMYFATVYFYLATRDAKDGHGNFVVLHLMTSLWGLEQTVRTIQGQQGGNAVTTSAALKVFYAVMVCVMSTSASGFPTPDSLMQIQADFPTATRDDDLEWEPIVKRGIAEEEEHNIKLVYVMKELWNRFGHWSGFSEAARSFTLTPNIRPTSSVFDA